MKKHVAKILLLLALILLPATAAWSAPKLSETKVSLQVGKTKQIYINNVTTSVTVKWSTSNKNVATVKDGLVTAKKKGSVTIKAKVNSKTLSCKVTVAEKSSTAKSTDYQIGDTWKVKGLFSLKINSVEETTDRNPYDDHNPKAVYIVTYTYKNLGYTDTTMGGLYISLGDKIVDAKGSMGYEYPGDVTYYPKATPIGATCKAQVCIGVDHAGDFKLYVDEYDSDYINKYSAVFDIKVK